MVPKNISDDTLKASAQFRQLGRFPLLSYYHKKNGVRFVLSLVQYVGSIVNSSLKHFSSLSAYLGSVYLDSNNFYHLDA